jgi:flagellin
MRIQTNTAANSALGFMRVNNQATERSIQKLSSGFRINRAGDDAAGLAIANKLRADVRGLARRRRTPRRAPRCSRSWTAPRRPSRRSSTA